MFHTAQFTRRKVTGDARRACRAQTIGVGETCLCERAFGKQQSHILTAQPGERASAIAFRKDAHRPARAFGGKASIRFTAAHRSCAGPFPAKQQRPGVTLHLIARRQQVGRKKRYAPEERDYGEGDA